MQDTILGTKIGQENKYCLPFLPTGPHHFLKQQPSADPCSECQGHFLLELAVQNEGPRDFWEQVGGNEDLSLLTIAHVNVLVSTALGWGHETKWDLGLGIKQSRGKAEQALPECDS